MSLLSLISHQQRTQLYPSHTQDWQAAGKVSWFMCIMENLLCSSQNLVDISIYSVYIIYSVDIIYIIYCVDIVYIIYCVDILQVKLVVEGLPLPPPSKLPLALPLPTVVDRW